MTTPLPENLPPLPPVPPGFDRWEYRGEGPLLNPIPDGVPSAGLIADDWRVHNPTVGERGCCKMHYLEAVREPAKDQPASGETSGVEAHVCGWQPIETVPSPSSFAVLVYCSERQNTYVAHNRDGHWRHFGGVGNALTETPTHWLPLPQPPEGGKP